MNTQSFMYTLAASVTTLHGGCLIALYVIGRPSLGSQLQDDLSCELALRSQHVHIVTIARHTSDHGSGGTRCERTVWSPGALHCPSSTCGKMESVRQNEWTKEPSEGE